MNWLKNAILLYLKSNPDKQFTAQNLCDHFRLQANITVETIKILETDGLIYRQGDYYYARS